MFDIRFFILLKYIAKHYEVFSPLKKNYEVFSVIP